MTEADLSNWRTAPHSRWAFNHIPEIMPVAKIAAAAPAAPLPRGAKDFSAFQVTASDGRALGLIDFLDATETDVFLVLHRGAVIFAHYANGNAPGTPHILMSASKAVTGLLTGILAVRGDIDTAAPIERYLPELASSAFAGATLRQLIDMRSGVDLSPDESQKEYIAAGWAPGDAPDHRSFMAALKTAKPHGGPFHYISANVDVLGWALERATGKSFAALVSEHLWTPMGAQTDACVITDRAGSARATGGICATAADFARLGRIMVLDGKADGRAVVPPEIVADIATGGDPTAWETGDWGAFFKPVGKTMRSRSGWYAVDDAPGYLFAMGIHGQNLFVDRADDIVVVKFSSQAAFFDYPAMLLTHRAFQALRKFLIET